MVNIIASEANGNGCFFSMEGIPRKEEERKETKEESKIIAC